jgi:hypothetical protein
MKMRASMTYGFGRLNSRGTLPWHATDDGQWKGNPSISAQVSRYMVSLRRQKVVFTIYFDDRHTLSALQVRNGETAMSARAVNPELLRALSDFNRIPEHWTIQPYAPDSRLGVGRGLQKWGGGRTRRLLQALYTIAFWCLLRFDEVLKIQFQDLEVVSSTCIQLTLPFRKTDQFGGEIFRPLICFCRLSGHCIRHQAIPSPSPAPNAAVHVPCDGTRRVVDSLRKY